MLEKILLTVTTLVTIRQVWHLGTKTKLDVRLKKMEIRDKRKGD